MRPLDLFLLLAGLGLLSLASVAARRFRRRAHGRRWGWERVAFAALVWLLVTVLVGSALGFHAFTMAHAPPDANPWTATPFLLIALPIYAVAELVLSRWAARSDSPAGGGSHPSRPAA